MPFGEKVWKIEDTFPAGPPCSELDSIDAGSGSVQFWRSESWQMPQFFQHFYIEQSVYIASGARVGGVHVYA